MLSQSPDGSLLSVRAVPGANRTVIEGEADGRLKVRLCAPPVEGKANKELVGLLSRSLGIRKSRISVVMGKRSRNKVVLLGGMAVAEAGALLKAACRKK